MQLDNHIVRRSYAKHLAEYDRIMSNGNFGHPDNYYNWKDRERELAAQLAGKSSRSNDPMHYWHGGQSN